MLETMYIPKLEKFNDLHLKEGKMAGLVDRREPVLSPYAIFKPNSTPREPTPPQPERNEVDDAGSMDYRFEEARLQSFENWPSPYVHPSALAAAGFYYTKQIDRVRCFECKTEVCCWEDGDDPMSEHQRWGGRCRFIRKLPCGNVPIGADPSAIPPPRPRGNDVCGPYGLEYRLGAGADTYASSSSASPNSKDQQHQMLPSASRLGALGIAIAKKPDFPDYQSYEARLASFAEWPASMAQTKERMAEAGFFYTGTGDQTTCYHCGGGLKQWEPQDDPWVQHAKWFSTCFYVRVVKGQEFINSVVGKETPALSEEEILRMNLPEYIRKVESSSLLQKREGEVKQQEQPQQFESELTELSETSAGPSTALPVPMPRTKLKEPVPTPKVNESVNSDEQQQVQQSQQSQAQVQTQTQQPQAQQQPSEKKPMDDARACKICYNEELGVVFLPCGHIVACVKCAPDMTTCAVCRKKVDMTVRAFFS